MPRFIKYVGCGTNKLIHDFIIHNLYFPGDVYNLSFQLFNIDYRGGMIEPAGRTLARLLPNLLDLCFVSHARANDRVGLWIRLAGCFPRRAKYRQR